MPYYVYVIELDKAFAEMSKAQEMNPRSRPDRPCIYVGSSSKEPEQRFYEHVNCVRNKRGPLYSRIVCRYGIRLRPRLYQRHNPIATRAEAQEKEKELTQRCRRKGYTVWSN